MLIGHTVSNYARNLIYYKDFNPENQNGQNKSQKQKIHEHQDT